MKKNFEIDPIIIILIVLIIIGLWIIGHDKTTGEVVEATSPVVEDVCVTVEDKTEAVTESAAVTENDTVTMALDKLWDVPLPAELQIYIDALCVNSPIEPEIIIAMCERESSYNPDAVGDDGNSIGLLQINPKWHWERMQKMGCPDLLNPYNNVTVGLDFLEELHEMYDGDIALVLMAYNGGCAYAERMTYVSEYALFVMNRAAELRGGVE